MKKGFSIAEAMIVLLIVSLSTAAMAPMMTKKSKTMLDGNSKWEFMKNGADITRQNGKVLIGQKVTDTKNYDARLYLNNDGPETYAFKILGGPIFSEKSKGTGLTIHNSTKSGITMLAPGETGITIHDSVGAGVVLANTKADRALEMSVNENASILNVRTWKATPQKSIFRVSNGGDVYINQQDGNSTSATAQLLKTGQLILKPPSDTSATSALSAIQIFNDDGPVVDIKDDGVVDVDSAVNIGRYDDDKYRISLDGIRSSITLNDNIIIKQPVYKDTKTKRDDMNKMQITTNSLHFWRQKSSDKDKTIKLSLYNDGFMWGQSLRLGHANLVPAYGGSIAVYGKTKTAKSEVKDFGGFKFYRLDKVANTDFNGNGALNMDYSIYSDSKGNLKPGVAEVASINVDGGATFTSLDVGGEGKFTSLKVAGGKITLDAAGNIAVRNSAGNQTASMLSDGTIYAQTLYVNGVPVTDADINDFKATKEMIAQLKEQNELLKAQNEALAQRVALLEMNINNPSNSFNRIVEEKTTKKDIISTLVNIK